MKEALERYLSKIEPGEVVLASYLSLMVSGHADTTATEGDAFVYLYDAWLRCEIDAGQFRYRDGTVLTVFTKKEKSE